MTKKAKRTVSMLLAGMLTLYSAAPVAAIDSIDTDANAVLTSADKAALFDVLDYVESQKELFGLGDVDFSELAIGNPISTYEYLETGLEECTPIYPLFYDGEVVAIAKCPEETYFQIDTGILVGELNAVLNEPISLIYDSEGVHIFDGIECSTVTGRAIETTNRTSFAENFDALALSLADSSSELATIELTSVNSCALLNYVPTTVYSTDSSTLLECNVDVVLQGWQDEEAKKSTEICWAASMACIINYETSTSYLATHVARMVAYQLDGNSADYDKSRQWEDYPSYFEYYDLSYKLDTSVIDEDTAYGYMANRHPIMVKFVRSDTEVYEGSHAVVLCGINTTRDYIRIMDPFSGFTTAFHNGARYAYESVVGEYAVGMGYVYPEG